MPGWLWVFLVLCCLAASAMSLLVIALCMAAGRSTPSPYDPYKGWNEMVRKGGRRRRRGGYVKPPASPMQRAATIRQQSEVDWGYSSSSPPPGGASVEWVGRRLLRDPSRLTGRGWYTVGTEALGASGRLRGDAA